MASPGRKIDRGTPTRWAVRVPTIPPPPVRTGNRGEDEGEERRKKKEEN